MKNKNKIKRNLLIAFTAITVAISLIAAFSSPVAAQSMNTEILRGGRGGNGNPGTVPGNGTGLTPLSEIEVQGLQDAILEEFGAFNLYEAVIAQFGDVIPFNQIALSEQQHTNALIRQAEKYGVVVPANLGLTQPISFTTLTDACAAGVAAEIADAALYDRLKAETTREDLLRLYDRLQSASLNQHLPEFELCD